MYALFFKDVCVPVDSFEIEGKLLLATSFDGKSLAFPLDSVESKKVRIKRVFGTKNQFDDLLNTVSVAGELHPELFIIEEDDNNSFRIRNVPICGCVFNDPKRPTIDRGFLDSIIANFDDVKNNVSGLFGSRYTWLPKLHIGHTDKAFGELPVIGFVDNLRRIGDWLYCDFRYLSEEVVNILRNGTFPDRSVEIAENPPRLLSVALLGTGIPYFKLPQMHKFSWTDNEEIKKFISGDLNEEKRTVKVSCSETPSKVKSMAVSSSSDRKVEQFISLLRSEGFKFVGDRASLTKFMDDYNLDDFIKMIREMIVSKKAKIMNECDEKDKDKMYNITIEDIRKFAQSSGSSEGVVDNTDPFISQSSTETRTDVDEMGCPTSSPKHFSSIDDEVKVMLTSVPENIQKFVAPIITKMSQEISEHKRFIQKQSSALSNMLQKLNDTEKRLRDADTEKEIQKYRADLVVLRTQGSSAVGDNENIDEHLGIIKALPNKELRDKYIATLKKAPKFSESKRVSLTGTTSGNGQTSNYTEKYIKRFSSNAKERAAIQRLGISIEQAALVSAFADLDTEISRASLDEDVEKLVDSDEE